MRSDKGLHSSKDESISNWKSIETLEEIPEEAKSHEGKGLHEFTSSHLLIFYDG